MDQKKEDASIYLKNSWFSVEKKEITVNDLAKEKKFFLELNGKQEGPFSKQEVVDFLNNKSADYENRIWTEGMSDWAKIKELSEFTSIQHTTPPPLYKTPPPLLSNNPFEPLPKDNVNKDDYSKNNVVVFFRYCTFGFFLSMATGSLVNVLFSVDLFTVQAIAWTGVILGVLLGLLAVKANNDKRKE